MTSLPAHAARPAALRWRSTLGHLAQWVITPMILAAAVYDALTDDVNLHSHTGDAVLLWTCTAVILAGMAWREILALRRAEAARIAHETELSQYADAVDQKIVELTEATRHLTFSETRYRTLVNTSSEIIWTTDPEGKVAGPLPAWQAFTGQNSEEVLGEGWMRAVHPDDAPGLKARWDYCVAARAPGHCEARVRRHDGVYRLLKTRGVPVFTDDGAIREWIGVSRDVTDKRAAEKLTAELQLTLSTRVAELETAIANVRTLQGLLPVCSYCKKVRDDQDYWHQLDQYIVTHTDTQVSHGICPDCYVREVEPELKALQGHG